jgi:hypothetical protein
MGWYCGRHWHFEMTDLKVYRVLQNKNYKLMKISTIILLLFVSTACTNENTTANEVDHEKLAGACKKCTCKGWRSDSGDPEKCLNIKVPTRELCAHLETDH